MSVTVHTNKPRTLLGHIKKAIDDGHIVTWQYDDEGDFTHTTSTEQWVGKAWLRPIISPGMLSFGLLSPKGVPMTKPLYGVYHGRFIEMLLTHFEDEFTEVTATAQMEVNVDHF
jgi:hypothetical protein